MRIQILVAAFFFVVFSSTSFAAPKRERIIDGTRVSASEFPYVARLEIDGDIFCTGTLISSRFILTAGHCFFDEQNKRAVGDTDVTARLNGETFTSSKVYIHPAYRSRSSACVEAETDAALIELSSDVTNVTPIPLLETPVPVGSTVVLAGYGSQGEEGPGQDDTFPEVGFINYGTTVVEGFGDNPPRQNSNSSYFYWTFESGEANTGSGDSGGPAFYDSNSVRYLAGITCGGDGNAEFGTESFQTRADLLASWAQSIAGTTPSETPAGFSGVRAQNASLGKSFSYRVPVYGSPTLTLSADSLPPGLVLDGTVIRGKPTSKGTYSVKLSASNSFGNAEKTLVIVVSGYTPTLTARTALLQFDYEADSEDFLDMEGTITVGSKFKPNKKTVTVRIGRFSKKFKFDKLGQSTGNQKSYFDLEGSMQSGAFKSSKVKYFLTLEKVPLFDELSTLGFPSSASASANQKVPLPLSVTIDGIEASKTVILEFKTSDERWRIAK